MKRTFSQRGGPAHHVPTRTASSTSSPPRQRQKVQSMLKTIAAADPEKNQNARHSNKEKMDGGVKNDSKKEKMDGGVKKEAKAKGVKTKDKAKDTSGGFQKKQKDNDGFKTNSNPAKITRVVRLKRKNGKIEQGCNKYIGRAQTQGGWNLEPSDWENPFPVKIYGLQESLKLFENHLRNERKDLIARLPELRYQELGCWCLNESPRVTRPTMLEACHGQVLIRLLDEFHPLAPTPAVDSANCASASSCCART